LCRKGPITAVTWIDNKPVNVVSTMEVVSGEATKLVKRGKKTVSNRMCNAH
jgi:hypothetical protein